MNWLAAVPYLLALAIGAGVAWPVARAPLQADLADLRGQHAKLRETNAETVRVAALAAAAVALGKRASDEYRHRLAWIRECTEVGKCRNPGLEESAVRRSRVPENAVDRIHDGAKCVLQDDLVAACAKEYRCLAGCTQNDRLRVRSGRLVV